MARQFENEAQQQRVAHNARNQIRSDFVEFDLIWHDFVNESH